LADSLIYKLRTATNDSEHKVAADAIRAALGAEPQHLITILDTTGYDKEHFKMCLSEAIEGIVHCIDASDEFDTDDKAFFEDDEDADEDEELQCDDSECPCHEALDPEEVEEIEAPEDVDCNAAHDHGWEQFSVTVGTDGDIEIIDVYDGNLLPISGVEQAKALLNKLSWAIGAAEGLDEVTPF
jgi:hypothetical protein